MTTDADDLARKVLGAASQAAEATQQLTLAAYEGTVETGDPVGVEVLVRLLDAARLVMLIEDDFTGERGQLFGAITNCLDEWAG